MQCALAATTERSFAKNGEAGEWASSLAELLRIALVHLDADRESAKAVITKATSLLQVQIDRQTAQAAVEAITGGLTAWQIRRVVGFVDHHLGGSIRVERLSEIAGLSSTHFSKAFRRSFGIPPHAYLIKQ